MAPVVAGTDPRPLMTQDPLVHRSFLGNRQKHQLTAALRSDERIRLVASLQLTVRTPAWRRYRVPVMAKLFATKGLDDPLPNPA